MDNLLVEVRFLEDDTRQSPGRLIGTLVTYGERARDRAERFRRDALQWADGGIVINEQHNRMAPILRTVPFLDGDALNIDAPLPNTQRGRDAATMVQNGTLTGLSVEFEKRGLVTAMVGGIREIRSATLAGAGLVDLASYRGSVVEVREGHLEMDLLEAVLPWL